VSLNFWDGKMNRVFSFVGASGSGKTTFIEKLIKLLADRGYKIGAIKHDAHRFDIDKPGKDSYRFKEAGAVVSVISNNEKIAMVKSHICKEPTIEEIILKYMEGVDLVITEGYKKSGIPKFEVLRKGNGNNPVAFDSEYLIGVITDYVKEDISELLNKYGNKSISEINYFSIDDIIGVADFITKQLDEAYLDIDIVTDSEIIERYLKSAFEPLKFLFSSKKIKVEVID